MLSYRRGNGGLLGELTCFVVLLSLEPGLNCSGIYTSALEPTHYRAGISVGHPDMASPGGLDCLEKTGPVYVVG
jgi:hypothetical protein